MKTGPFDLGGKVAIVTGGNGGIGLGMARGLAQAGAGIAVVGRNEAKSAAAAADLGAMGVRAIAVTTDVTDKAAVDAMVERTLREFGRIDILINNAGINTALLRREGQPIGKIWETSPQEFRRIVEVNIVATFLMTRAVVPSLLAQRWGRIINVTTSLDTMWRTMMQPYGGSKAANEAILTAMAFELEGSGVTANVLVPGGAVDTRLVSKTMMPDRSKLIKAEVMIAPLVWLCSNAADGVNGQRFIAMRWDDKLPPAEAAKHAGAPMAWQQLGLQGVHPDAMR